MPLTIGRLASAAGVNIQTVRYYERRGLMPKAPRTRSGYRQYGDEAVARLRFIRRAQDLGFSLEEIRGLLELRVRGTSSVACEQVEAKTRQKISLVEGKIRELKGIRRGLEQLVSACQTRNPTGDCPILEALDPVEGGGGVSR